MRVSVLKADLLVPNVEKRNPRIEQKLDAVIGVELRGAQWNPFVRCVACEKIFGQIGAIAGGRIVRTDDQHAAVVAFTAEHLRRSQSGCAASNDHNRGGQVLRVRRGFLLAGGLSNFLSDKNRVGSSLDAPTRNGI